MQKYEEIDLDDLPYAPETTDEFLGQDVSTQRAMYLKCRDCLGGVEDEIAACPESTCEAWSGRVECDADSRGKTARAKQIQARCSECQGGSVALPRECAIYQCAYWQWRRGRHESTTKMQREKVLEYRKRQGLIS